MTKVSRLVQEQQLVGATGQKIEIARVERGVVGSAYSRNQSLADSGVQGMLIIPTTAENILVRVHFGGSVGGDAVLEFYEDSTFSDNGTPLSIVNRNRFLDSPFGTTIFENPVESALGTLIFEGFVPGGTRKDSAGAEKIDALQWILDPDLNYYARVTNIAGQAEPVSIEFTFDEDVRSDIFST